MATVQGVITNIGQSVLAQAHAGVSGFTPLPLISYFKVGLGGFQILGGTRSPRTPLATQTDLDVIQNPGNYNTNVYNQLPAGATGWYGSSSLTPLVYGTNISFIAGTSTTL